MRGSCRTGAGFCEHNKLRRACEECKGKKKASSSAPPSSSSSSVAAPVVVVAEAAAGLLSLASSVCTAQSVLEENDRSGGGA